MYDLILEGATIISPHGRSRADVCVENGRFVYIGERPAGPARDRVSAHDHWVIPGLIDTHVHFRSPGHPHKETWASGSRAAATGGVTTVFDMPNTSPPTLTRADWEYKRGLAAEASRVNYGIWVGGASGHTDDIRELMDSGDACGIKVFMGASTGPLLVDDPTLVTLFRETKGLIGVHAEDEALLIALRDQFAHMVEPNHNHVRPPEVAVSAIRRLIELVGEYDRAIHICHVSSAAELAMLEATRGRLPITTEVCPHHLFLNSDQPAPPEAQGNRIKVNPPVRDEADRKALWAGIRRGDIDTLGSDHAPHTLAEKALPYWQAPSGIPGVETTLPLMLTAVQQGRLSMERLVQLGATEPARVFGLKTKGLIEVGFDADFVMVKAREARVYTSEDIESHVRWSPFEGMRMVPKPDAVYVRGDVVARYGKIVNDGLRGSLVRPGAWG